MRRSDALPAPTIYQAVKTNKQKSTLRDQLTNRPVMFRHCQAGCRSNAALPGTSASSGIVPVAQRRHSPKMRALLRLLAQISNEAASINNAASASAATATTSAAQRGRASGPPPLARTLSEKAVVFSQHKGAVLHASAVLRENGIGHVRIVSGSTSEENHSAVRRFNEDRLCRVFLLQAGQAAAGQLCVLAACPRHHSEL